MDKLDKAISKILHFRDAREWQQFHTPKNLAASLSIEAAEVLEHFQWITEEQSKNLSSEALQKVGKEIADVAIYMLLLAHELNIDVVEAINKKVEENNVKYPVEKSKGNVTKYTDL